MNKEKILEILKEAVLAIKNCKDDKELRKALDNAKEIETEINKLNSCDTLWLNDEYGKWFEEEIKPFVIEHQKKMSEWGI